MKRYVKTSREWQKRELMIQLQERARKKEGKDDATEKCCTDEERNVVMILREGRAGNMVARNGREGVKKRP